VRRFRKINTQNGAAMVEFAIVLPLLLILIFGIIEFGVMFYDKAVITNASREGVRAGITGLGDPEIKQIVLNYCNANLVNLGNNNDAFDPEKIFISSDGTDLIVKLEYNYDLLLGSFFGFDNTTISAETVMRIE
jgi:Flp pilus assembly protein TadG